MEETDDQQEEYASRGRDNYEDGEGRSENNGNEGITNLYIKQLTPEVLF